MAPQQDAKVENVVKFGGFSSFKCHTIKCIFGVCFSVPNLAIIGEGGGYIIYDKAVATLRHDKAINNNNNSPTISNAP